MDLIKVDGETFAHPYFQSASMFIGEIMCLGLYGAMILYDRHKNPNNADALIKKAQPTYEERNFVDKLGSKAFAIPAFLDTVGSTLSFIGLVLSAPSVYQMIRAFNVVVVAVYSVIFLKRHLYLHEKLGVSLIFTGVFLVGLSSILFKSNSAKNPALGVFMLAIGQLFTGALMVVEEKILRRIKVDPMKAVGIEGTAGVIYFIILLPILNLIPCSNADLCSGGVVEDSVKAFYQLGNSTLLFGLWILFIITLCLFNWTSVSTTNVANALARSTIDASRTVVIWIISILVGWETFIWLQLIGFLVLISGTLLYNEIVVVPLLGLKESVEAKREVSERNKKFDIGQDEFKGITPERNTDPDGII